MKELGVTKDDSLVAVFAPVSTPEAGQNPVRLARSLIHD